MYKEFLTLFQIADDLKTLVEERDRLLKKKSDLKIQARIFHDGVVKTYSEEERRIDDQLEKMAIEHQENELEVIEFMKKKTKFGLGSDEEKRLTELRISVANYDLDRKAMQDMKTDIVISASDIRKRDYYSSQGHLLGIDIQNNERAILNRLADIKGSIDEKLYIKFDPYITNREINSVGEMFADFDNMRKEKTE